jgi:RNA polymerase sigma-70 factor (ECF subfamily)
MRARQSESATPRLTRRTERRVVAQAREGCEDAARQLVDSHKDRLFAFVWRILRDHEESEDICQEAFLRAFSSLDSFSTQYRFSTWLFTIGYRLCLNRLRRRKEVTSEMDFASLRSTEQDAPRQLAESEEARRLKNTIWEAVDKLTVPQRAAVMLFYREGLSCDAIAGMMEMPMATVKSHLHRARAKLRDMLGPMVQDWSEIQSLRDAAS